jgi:pyruvate/2-oxoglutarate dehydrogenase complex dihydrolipoamide dehydrogenase (E3) component
VANARAYDLIVIGSGPAGEKGAAQAAYFGKRVALIERAPYLGGAGVNTGTVPSKTLRETALYYSGIRKPSDAFACRWLRAPAITEVEVMA